jgi:hypothetical protein
VLVFEDIAAVVVVEVDKVVDDERIELVDKAVVLDVDKALDDITLAIELVLITLAVVAVDDGGGTRSTLGFVGDTKSVAVSVACVLDKASTCPTHIENAFSITDRLLSLPMQAPILSSDVIHCTAPSPTV